ncbi:MAG: hypothetical protein ACLT0Y_07185 [Christensenellales bacterium]
MQITSAMILATRRCLPISIQDTQNITKETLGLYFSNSIINSGELDKLKSSYDSFSISNFVESNETSWVWAWPWGFSATVKIHVSVKNLQGEYTGDLDEGEAAPEIAAFPNGTYSLRLRKRGGQWHVTDIRCVSQDPVESIAPMPTLKPSPTPVETEPPEDVDFRPASSTANKNETKRPIENALAHWFFTAAGAVVVSADGGRYRPAMRLIWGKWAMIFIRKW